MDESSLLWILTTLVSIQMAVIGAIWLVLWRHLDHCREVQSLLGSLGTLPQEIKTLRRRVHDAWNALMKISGKLEIDIEDNSPE